MDSQQLIDTLAAHIALYHSSSSSSSSSPNPSSSPRSSILQWFSSLSAQHRRASLTILHPHFLHVLCLMLCRLRSRGPSVFFLLSDLPSSSELPSLLSRRSLGLLARASSSNPHFLALCRAILMFSSQESERISDCPLDSFTVAEDFVADVGCFVETMDGISGGRFLRGEVEGLGAPWVEMDWLKDMGYYSMEAFLANKIEVALRLSWLASAKGKKMKVGKGKEKEIAAAVAGACVAANVFWRKKRCIDWWVGLGAECRRTMLVTLLGKESKFLVNDFVKWSTTANVEDDLSVGHQAGNSWQSMKRNPYLHSDVMLSFRHHQKLTPMADCLNRLAVIREISLMFSNLWEEEFEKEAIFFSSLTSSSSISDFILRKLRGFLMIVSIDYANLELIGDPKLNPVQNKNKDEFGMSYRKGKKKLHNSKRLSLSSKLSVINPANQKPSLDHACNGPSVGNKCSSLGAQQNTLSLSAKKKSTSVVDTVESKTPLGGYDLEPSKDLVDCTVRVTKKRSGRKRAKNKAASSKSDGNPDTVNQKFPSPSCPAKVDQATFPVPVSVSTNHLKADSVRCEQSKSSSANVSDKPDMAGKSESSNVAQINHVPHPSPGCSFDGVISCPSSSKYEDGDIVLSNCNIKLQGSSEETFSPVANDNSNKLIGNHATSPKWNPGNTFALSAQCLENVSVEELDPQKSGFHCDTTSESISPYLSKDVLNKKNTLIQCDTSDNYAATSSGSPSHEWPNLASFHYASVNSQNLPTATDRLHLDVSQKLPNHHQSFLPPRHQVRSSSTECGRSRILPSLALPMSFDWPPMVKSYSRLSQTVTASYDSGYASRLQSSFCSGFSSHRMQINGSSSVNDWKHTWDVMDVYDSKIMSEFTDDTDSYWLSEEESDTHTLSTRDYNQFFGGGVMYWNTSEHVGTGFSRPPSYSSEDSSWAWHEAELNRTIDDMVGMPGISASYNTNGLASPPAAPFCSPFDSLGPGHQAVGYAITGNDMIGKPMNSVPSVSDVTDEKHPKSLNNSPNSVEGTKGDPLPYPVLRPIIVPTIARKGSRSEFMLSHDHKNPCLPSSIRDPPRIKRPPSPVVLSVPRVPRPPPPSPVGGSRKRGYPIVRSGSSSPRHWGMRTWYREEASDENYLSIDGAEVVWPSWGNKGISAIPVVQSVGGSLLQDHLLNVSQLACDQDHPDVALPLQPPDLLNSNDKTPLSILQCLLHDEIDSFWKQVSAEHLTRKPYINWAVMRVTRALQVLWPRSRTNIFGSCATGLALPTSDVDLVVSLPPVRNLEPIKEAGILEGRNGIKETCLQHAARYLANQDWVRNDSLKTIENTAIPVINLVAEVPPDYISSNRNSSTSDTRKVWSINAHLEHGGGSHSDQPLSQNNSLPLSSKLVKEDDIDVKLIRLDISFKSPSHTGLQTSELVGELTQQFPAIIPLALVLKQFLADRSLDDSYSGGLSSYCLVLLVTRFLQHEHHIGRSINQNLGSLLMDFLYFFGNVFDPRQMRISIQGSGVYMKRERGLSFDPVHIDDPLYPTNNVGRNCFRIHQCIKAFADAYAVLENEQSQFSDNCPPTSLASFMLLETIIPSIGQEFQSSVRSG
ncbi:putative polynucleotide adenylyltransferase [Dioscorea sansibarensis]